MTAIRIKSDTYEETFYRVMLGRDGLAFACTCPAGQRNHPCKHLVRAEARKVFERAWKKHLSDAARKGKNTSEVHAAMVARYEHLRTTHGTDVAIVSVIETAFPDHPTLRGLRARIAKARLEKEG